MLRGILVHPAHLISLLELRLEQTAFLICFHELDLQPDVELLLLLKVAFEAVDFREIEIEDLLIGL